MSRKKELLKNTLILLFGKFCTQFLSFFLLPLYTTLLNTSEYGTLDLINTYIALIIPAINLELQGALFRFLVDERKNKENQKKVYTNIVVGIITFTSIFIALLLIFNLFIKINYLWFIVLNIVTMVMSAIALQVARGLGKNIDYTIGSVICAVFMIILNILFLTVFNMRVDGMLLSSGIANFLCFLYIFIKLKLYKLFDLKVYNKKEIKTAIKFSAPLVPNSISWWIINVSDRTMVTYFLGVAVNGIYSLSNKFSGIFISVYNVFNLSWTESATLHIKDDDKDEFFTSTINTMLKLFTSVALLIIVVMPFIFNILVNKNYNDAYNYIPILLIGSIFNVIIGLVSPIYIAIKDTKEVAKTAVVAAIINIGINLFAIKWLGIYGACLSTAIAFAIMALYRYYDIQKYVKVKIKREFVLSIIAAFSLAMYFYYKNNLIGNVLNLMIILLYSLYINKELITTSYKGLLNMVIKKASK